MESNPVFSLRPLIDDNARRIEDNRHDINNLERDFGFVGQQIAALNKAVDRNYELIDEGFSGMETCSASFERRITILVSVSLVLSAVAAVLSGISVFY